MDQPAQGLSGSLRECGGIDAQQRGEPLGTLLRPHQGEFAARSGLIAEQPCQYSTRTVLIQGVEKLQGVAVGRPDGIRITVERAGRAFQGLGQAEFVIHAGHSASPGTPRRGLPGPYESARPSRGLLA